MRWLAGPEGHDLIVPVFAGLKPGAFTVASLARGQGRLVRAYFVLSGAGSVPSWLHGKEGEDLRVPETTAFSNSLARAS